MKCPVCKKNISKTALKCPYCKTRTGLLCSHCNTVNPIDNLVCLNCGKELLKICPKCNSVNFPTATKCRKCGSPFDLKNKKNTDDSFDLKYHPKLYSIKRAVEILTEELKSKDKKIFSISGPRGIGKSTVLYSVIKKLESQNLQWCVGKCTQLTQVSPGGVVQDMLLNLFNLPGFCIENDELKNNASEFFKREFRFLNSEEVSDFLNFLYNFKDGNFEDIIINKKKTYSILNKIFDTFANTEKFVFVIDNFDFIDGFSVEFFTNFIQRGNNWKNLKFIVIYNDYKPVSSFFGFENRNLKSYLDLNIQPLSIDELENCVNLNNEIEQYLSKREKDIIFLKSKGNLAYVQQAISYAFDCQISDKAFILPDNFSDLIKARLEILKKVNFEAYKLLCGGAILGDKLNINLVREIFGYEITDFNAIISFLVKSNFLRQVNDIFYEFNNLFLWETILKNITKDSVFDDVNVKIGKAISVFTINTNATLGLIAHNLKENRMAFDLWTKTTRLASYIGDINLYVIAQKQCLALINEFNENETLNIRYNISERLGKLLTEYDPEEALEFLPDAIAHAKESGDEVKEIELLSYLTACCNRTGKYFGNVECVDDVLKKIENIPNDNLEVAMIKTAKLSALIDIGNCGEVINLIDNDILPVLNNYLAKPSLSKLFPMIMLYDTWLRVQLMLARALALQGNSRSFDVLKTLFDTINKHKINDKLLICQAKLVLAYANMMKGDYNASLNILQDLDKNYKDEVMDNRTLSRWNLVYILNHFFEKKYDGLREILFDGVTFANNIGDSFTKNILKVLLGKIFKDELQAKKALDIYNEQVNYFAQEKMALGALLSWYLIAEATIVIENPRGAIDIATQALEIAQNPKIDNTFFIVILNSVLADAFFVISDYETAKMHLESAITLAKKSKIYDILSILYLKFGKYYQDIGSIPNQIQVEYLKGALTLYAKATEIVVNETRNNSIKIKIEKQKEFLYDYCSKNGISL